MFQQTTKELLTFLLLCLFNMAFMLIANNGNILTDGKGERGYLQRKHSEI